MKLGMNIREGETTTYIYLCGIKPARSIQLTDKVGLLPVSTSPDPDDMVTCIMKNGSGSEFELGMLIATLRNTTAMIRVDCDNSKELVIHAWNSQTICVLIGALLNCEVAWYFQANKPANMFDAKTKISTITGHMLKFPSKVEKISKKKCAFLEHNIALAFALTDDERFWHATNALWSCKWNPNQAVQLSVIWGGIEALFLIEKNIKHKLSIAASRFLAGDDSMVENIKLLYQSRCKAIHERKSDEEESLVESEKLLHDLVLRCVQLQSVPDVNSLLK